MDAFKYHIPGLGSFYDSIVDTYTVLRIHYKPIAMSLCRCRYNLHSYTNMIWYIECCIHRTKEMDECQLCDTDTVPHDIQKKSACMIAK